MDIAPIIFNVPSDFHISQQEKFFPGSNGGPQFKGPPNNWTHAIKYQVSLIHHSHPSLVYLRGSFHCVADFKSACF